MVFKHPVLIFELSAFIKTNLWSMLNLIMTSYKDETRIF